MNATQIKKFYSIMKNSGTKISIEFDGYYVHIVSNYWALEITSMDWVALSQLFEKDGMIINPDEANSWIVENMKTVYPGQRNWETAEKIARQQTDEYFPVVMQDSHFTYATTNRNVKVLYYINDEGKGISLVNEKYYQLADFVKSIPYSTGGTAPLILIDAKDDWKLKGIILPIKNDRIIEAIQNLNQIIG